MASEVFYSAIADGRVPAVLNQMLIKKFADRWSLMGSSGLIYLGNVGGSGSATIKTSIASLNGHDRMQAVAENSSVTNTDVDVTSVSVSVARQALQRSISDLAGMTDSNGLNLQALVEDMSWAAAMRFQEMVAALPASFSSSVSNTTVPMTVDDFFTAQFTLMQSPGAIDSPPMAMLYNSQVTHLINSLRGESGSIQFKSDAQAMLDYKGQGYQGSLNGIDVFMSSLVPTANAGADSAGGMWTRGALGYADGIPNAIVGAGGLVYPAGTRIYVEFERDASGALTKIVGNYFVGVVEIEDGRGVSIVTDR